MRDYLGDLVIRIVPYRRLYGSRILCVREEEEEEEETLFDPKSANVQCITVS